ncbi:MAG: RNA polymerase subunit sigma-70, partial [Pirellulales bacterium]|nr:RNA polymerase subunit sigma-70 [Pirellulales bacterium]
MNLMEQDLSQLIARGTQQGFLTYEEVNAYLPDEDVNPEKLDKLLLAIERHGIQLVEAHQQKTLSAGSRPEPNVPDMRSEAADATVATGTEMPKAS